MESQEWNILRTILKKLKRELRKISDKVEREKTRVECGCGGSYVSRRKSEHMKTKTHIKYIESLL